MKRRVDLVAVLALTLLAGCSETTLRLSSLEKLQLDGHDITVSWIRADDRAVDLVVYEEPLWVGSPTPDMPWLDRALARRAAETVMAGRCGPAVTEVQNSASVGDRRFAFRYACGRQ